jgi:hypothetical protein|tara:strand:+ start:228 stop:695 length:468 start_codon:yes stop_codon:yes gene_type:complete
MAHFAKLDENNQVINVIVINNNDIIDGEGVEQEALGIAKCKEISNEPNSTWVQTSVNGNFRGRYANIGGSYDSVNDVFIEEQPGSNWNLDANFDWQPPLPRPTKLDGYTYKWDDATYTSSGNTKGWVAGDLNQDPETFSYLNKVFNHTSNSWEDL